MGIELEKIRNHKLSIIGLNDISRSSVVITLLERDHGYDLLFEVRSSKISDQPGDICLPGGRIEPDESSKQAAIREMCEELLVQESQIELIGRMDIFHTENAVIYPYVAVLHDYHGSFSRDEVEKVFAVPYEFFESHEPEVYDVNFVPVLGDNFPYDRINGGRNYPWRKRVTHEMFYQYEDHTIWGITARIINAFVKCQND